MIESTKKLGEKTTKKSLTQNLSKRLLELEFKSNHTIKFSTFTFIVKKNIAIIVKHANVLLRL